MATILVTPADFLPGQFQLAQHNADVPLLQSYIDREEKKTIHRLLGSTLGDLLIANIQTDKTTATSGLLTIGTSYFISAYNVGDDFSNVGGTNVGGSYFIATGTTPAVWSNSSSLISNRIKRYDDILNPFFFSDNLSNGFDFYCNWNYYNSNRNQFMDSFGLHDMLLCDIYYCYVSETQARHTQSGVASTSAENAEVQSFSNAMRFGESKWNNGGLDTWLAIQWLCRVKNNSDYPDYTGTRPVVRYSSIMG